MKLHVFDSSVFSDEQVITDEHYLSERNRFLAQLLMVCEKKASIRIRYCRYMDSPDISDWVCHQISTSARPEQSLRRERTVYFCLKSPETFLLKAVCRIEKDRLTIQGTATEFHFIQMAIELGRKLANGRQVDVHIDVQTSAQIKPRF